jgi:hypothetical protein
MSMSGRHDGACLLLLSAVSLFDSRRTIFATQATVAYTIRTIDTIGRFDANLGRLTAKTQIPADF